MIGGVDMACTGRVLDGDKDVLLRVARAAWPQAFVENGDGSFAAAIVRDMIDAIGRNRSLARAE
jgi:hypothetical protein